MRDPAALGVVGDTHSHWDDVENGLQLVELALQLPIEPDDFLLGLLAVSDVHGTAEVTEESASDVKSGNANRFQEAIFAARMTEAALPLKHLPLLQCL